MSARHAYVTPPGFVMAALFAATGKLTAALTVRVLTLMLASDF